MAALLVHDLRYAAGRGATRHAAAAPARALLAGREPRAGSGANAFEPRSVLGARGGAGDAAAGGVSPAARRRVEDSTQVVVGVTTALIPSDHARGDTVIARAAPPAARRPPQPARARRGPPVDDAALRRMLEAARWAPSATTASPGASACPPRRSSLRRPVRRADARQPGLGGHVPRRCCSWPPPTPTATGPRAALGRYDAGQAVAHLHVQAQAAGLVVHQMGGFDPAAAAARFDLPAPVTPLVVVAVGTTTRTPPCPSRSPSASAHPGARGPRRAAPGPGTVAAALGLTACRRAPERTQAAGPIRWDRPGRRSSTVSAPTAFSAPTPVSDRTSISAYLLRRSAAPCS